MDVYRGGTLLTLILIGNGGFCERISGIGITFRSANEVSVTLLMLVNVDILI